MRAVMAHKVVMASWLAGEAFVVVADRCGGAC